MSYKTNIYELTCGKVTSVYSTASSKSAVLRKINRHEIVEVLEEGATFSKCKCADGVEGYIRNTYMSIHTEPYICIANNKLTVREKATVNSDKIGVIMPGHVIHVIDLGKNFAMIEWNGKIAYAGMKYMRKLESEEYTDYDPYPINYNNKDWTNVMYPGRCDANNNMAREGLLELALERYGTPYEYGAEGPVPIDCSAFIYYLYGNVTGQYVPNTGEELRRVSEDQGALGIEIDKPSEIGDLIFFKCHNDNDKTIDHVGMYIGDNHYIHATSDWNHSMCIRIDRVGDTFYNNYKVKVKRYI